MGFFNQPPAAQDFNTEMERQSFYLYDIWRPIPSLSITGAVSYDHLRFPTNYRNAPILDSESARSQVSPKAGVIWNPFGKFVVRAAYARALGGVSFDESVQLEPNQVAGFNQVFRSVISESVVGSVAAPSYETAGVLLENKWSSGTYASIKGTVVQSEVGRRIGTFDAFVVGGQIDPPIVPSSTAQHLRYQEQNLLCTVNQLLGDNWSLGGAYQVTVSDLRTTFPEVPRATLPALAESQQTATLQQAQVFALYSHPTGFFARVEGLWFDQSNTGYSPDIPGADFVQINLIAGFRFRRNYGEVSLGLLNVTDQDYKLNPLNPYNELPRDRTLAARVRLNF